MRANLAVVKELRTVHVREITLDQHGLVVETATIIITLVANLK